MPAADQLPTDPRSHLDLALSASRSAVISQNEAVMAFLNLRAMMISSVEFDPENPQINPCILTGASGVKAVAVWSTPERIDEELLESFPFIVSNPGIHIVRGADPSMEIVINPFSDNRLILDVESLSRIREAFPDTAAE